MRQIGFALDIDGILGPETVRVVSRFQEGWARGREGLPVDGRLDEPTCNAIDDCAADGGRLSDHFWFAEFRSKGNGDIRVRRELVLALEEVRAVKGRPLHVLSGYRDAGHNERTGSDRQSRHLYGEAVDIAFDFGLTFNEAFGLRRFSGISFSARRRIVRHLDVRGIPFGSPATPATVDDPDVSSH